MRCSCGLSGERVGRHGQGPTGLARANDTLPLCVRADLSSPMRRMASMVSCTYRRGQMPCYRGCAKLQLDEICPCIYRRELLPCEGDSSVRADCFPPHFKNISLG